MNPSCLFCGAAGAISLFLTTGVLRAQTDNFDDGDDAGWTRFEPLGPFGGTTIGVTGGKYFLTCQSSPNAPEFGPARCGAMLPDIYQTFLVMVDINDFDPADDTSAGILARIQPGAGPGSVNGYSFTYQAKDKDVQLSRIVNEQPTALGSLPHVELEAGKSYRIVFFGVANWLEGRIYDLANPLVPVVTTTAMDSTYSQGNCGLVVFADENTRARASFDNYAATDGTLAPPDVAVADGGFSVSWDLTKGLPYSLYSSNDLFFWFQVTPDMAGGGRINYFSRSNVEFPARYFRLRLDPQPSIAVRPQ